MSLFFQEIVLDGNISTAEAREKWENAIESGARKMKVKGKSLFLHSRTGSLGTGKYVLHYHREYGRDFCDAVFTGEIFEYEEGTSQIHGKVTVSKQMKRFGIILAILSFPLAIVFDWILFYITPHLAVIPFMPEGFQFNQLFVLIAATLAIIAIGIMCMMIDKRRVKEIMDYLQDFLRKENDN
jgi:hypothetical protein